MTDDTLPGLPQAPQPAPDPQPDDTPLDTALRDLHAAAIEVIMHSRVETPNLGPADVAMVTTQALIDAMRNVMGPRAVMTGLLAAFEGMHKTPMGFIQINKAKIALEALASQRRAREGVTAGGVILPGQP